MCPKYVQTSLSAQNMPKMWPNILIVPKLCPNTWYFSGHLYQGMWIMSKLQQNAQNLPLTCQNFGHILGTFWVQVQNIGKCSKTINLGKFWTKMSLFCAYSERDSKIKITRNLSYVEQVCDWNFKYWHEFQISSLLHTALSVHRQCYEFVAGQIIKGQWMKWGLLC